MAAQLQPAEIACRGTGKLLVNEAALDRLQTLRDRLGKPMIVRSAYRSPEHNRAVGGAKASKHIEGIAFDIAMANHDPEAFEGGRGRHARSGSRASASTRARASCTSTSGRRAAGASASRSARPAFAAETPPAREVLAESRTLKGGGAGVATIGAAGVEVAQQVLRRKARSCRWSRTSKPCGGCSITIALAGIAVAIYARLDDWKRRER